MPSVSARAPSRRITLYLGQPTYALTVVIFSLLLSSGIGSYLSLLLVVTLLTPIGFLMGMPFPSGLSRLERQYSQAVCWAWAVNAAASVLGSVSAIFLAIHIGLAQTVLIGGVCYLGAFAAVVMTPRGEGPTRIAR